MKQRLQRLIFVLSLLCVFVFQKNIVTFAEESKETMSISELAANGGYTEVVLDDYAITKKLEDVAFSENSYTYPSSYAGLGNSTGSNRGILYKVTLSSQISANFTSTNSSSAYIYDESFSCLGFGYSLSNYSTTETKVYYVWLMPRLENTKTTTTTFYTGSEFSDVKDKALPLKAGELTDLTTASDAYTYISVCNTTLEGYLFSNTMSGRYVFEDLPSGFRFIALDADGSNYKSSWISEGSEYYLDAPYYLVYPDTMGSTGFSFTLTKAKALSELEIPVLTKDVAYTTKNTDTKVCLKKDSNTQQYIYAITLAAHETIAISLTDDEGNKIINNTYINRTYSFYDTNGNVLGTPANIYDNWSEDSYFRFTNNIDKEVTYYIAISPDMGVDAYTVLYTDAAEVLSRQTEHAIVVEANKTVEISENDSRFIRNYMADRTYEYETEGILFKYAMEANETIDVTFPSASTYWEMYTDLNKTPTSTSCSSSYTYTTNTASVIYFFIKRNDIEGKAFCIKKTKTISYDEADELKLGENAFNYDGNVVEFPDGSRKQGKLFHVTLPDDGDYILKAAFSGDTIASTDRYELYPYYMNSSNNLESDEIITLLGASFDSSTKGNYLINNTYKEQWLLITTTDKKGMLQDSDSITLTLEKLPELSASDIKHIEPDTTYTISADSYQYGIYKDIQVLGGIAEFTLPAGKEIVINDKGNSIFFSLYVKENDAWGKVSHNYGIFTLCNETERDITYLYVVNYHGLYDDISVTFGALTPATPTVDIETASFTELKVGETIDTSELSKQKIRFNHLAYNGGTVEESTYEYKTLEGYWLKITVPEGKCYGLNASSTSWDKYLCMYTYNETLGAYSLDSSGRMKIALTSEGTYYFFTEDNNITYSLADLKSIETLSDSAYTITEADIKAGSISCKIPPVFCHLCDYSYGTSKGYTIEQGALLKLTVPVNTCYEFGEGVYYYNLDDITTPISNKKLNYIENTTTEAKTYYVWFGSNASLTETVTKTLSIKEDHNYLMNFLDNAEKLEIGTFDYKTDDTANYDIVSYYNSFGDKKTIQNARIYKLNAGVYKLSTVFEDAAAELKVYTCLKNGAISEFPLLSAANPVLDNIYVYDELYLILADSSDMGISQQLNLQTGTDKRLTSNLDKLPVLQEGENEYTASHAIFYYKLSSSWKDNSIKCYSETYGPWYTYTVAPHTTVNITVPMCGDFTVYDNPDGAYIADIENYGCMYTYQYKNDTEKAVVLYLNLNKTSDIQTPSDKITVSVEKKLNELSDKAIAITGSTYTTTSDNTITAKLPKGYYTDDNSVHYENHTGKLYKLTIPKKSNLTITADKTITLVMYQDLDVPPVWGENGTTGFYNLSNEDAVYYLWVDGDNDGVILTIATDSLDVTISEETNEDGETVMVEETIVPEIIGDATIKVEETKDAETETPKDTVIKIEQDVISEDAIQKSIEIVEKKQSEYENNGISANVNICIKAEITNDASVTVNKKIIDSLKNMSATVDFQIAKKDAAGNVAYTWTFAASSIAALDTGKVSSINTKVDIYEDADGYDKKEEIADLTESDVKNYVVSFSHEGQLPENTEVKIKVGNGYEEGSTVYYYHIDNNTLTLIGSSVVKNGYVPMIINHCSDYVIRDKKVGETACSHANTEIRNAKTASCTEEGYTGDKYCLDCDELLEKGTAIAKSSHTESDWIIDKAATTEVAGSKHKKCTVCGEVLETQAIAKLPTEETQQPEVTPDVTTRYTTHVQTYGWQGDENNTNKWFTNGKMAGTSGKAKRLEGIKIKVFGNDNLGIQYTTHCQSYGWLPWSANGEMNGTEGEAKRLEAIKIQLTGADKDKYDVYYRVHAQSYGWLGWVKNGAPSGTAGYAKRLEGIQIVVVKKGEAAPGLNYGGVNAAASVHQSAGYLAKSGSSPVVGSTATSNTNPQVAGASNVNISYRTHVQSYGWQGWKYNGQMSGTSGQAKRLEGINIKLTNKPYSGSVVYTTHVQSYGWQGNENNKATWKKDGQMSGTSGQAKRLEAIRIDLTGEMAEHYDIYYRVHAQSYGWLNWAKNGEAAGTAGLAKRLEGIQIVLVPKGGKAPAKTYNGVTSVRTQAYIKK